MKEVLQKYLDFKYNRKNIIHSLYRPFVKKYFYFDKIYTHRIYQNSKIFGFRNQFENKVICFSGTSSNKPFQCLIVNVLQGLDFLEKTQCLPLYRYENGERIENITDWALGLFQNKCKDQKISKLDIFHYVYAVLHSPEYRKKYEIDLKRDFPRIPLYADFWKYAEAGKKLMELHLNYEQQETYKVFENLIGLKVNRKPWESLLPKRKNTKNISDTSKMSDISADEELLQKIKPDLKLRVKDGMIEIDELTSITNIPAEVWEYRLGNRSAIEWILDQYKPYKSDDATIQENFNTYDFFDYKEEVIDLILKVIYVSVETTKIVKTL